MKLCYKEYPIKSSIGAARQFEAATGKNLMPFVLNFITVHSRMRMKQKEGEATELELMLALHEAGKFEDASHAFKALIDEGYRYRKIEKVVPLEEVQDAMYRVGWVLDPEIDNEWTHPWPLVMLSVAYEIDADFERIKKELKKKAATSEQ